jgi:hypothetical protein
VGQVDDLPRSRPGGLFSIVFSLRGSDSSVPSVFC